MNGDASEKEIHQGTLGDFLKNKRQEEGKTLEELAREEHLRVDHLKSIEASLWSELPGEAYARAFLISLSKRFKLDREELLNWYAAEIGQKRGRETSPLPLDDESSQPAHYSRSSLLLTLVIVLIALLVYNSLRNDHSPSAVPSPLPVPELDKPSTAQIDSSDEEEVFLEAQSSDLHLSQEEPSSAILSSSEEKKINGEGMSASSSSATALSSLVQSPARSSAALSSARKSSGNAEFSSQKNAEQKPAAITPSHIVISCEKDSAWIEIRTASEPAWAVWVREHGAIYSRSSSDTMHIRTGNGELLRFQLNGKPMATPATTYFSIYNGQRVR